LVTHDRDIEFEAAWSLLRRVVGTH